MIFETPLILGTLIKRYKRFLADVKLEDGTVLTAHCPNTGTMLSCSDPGSMIGLSISDNPKRKYPHTLEMVKTNNTWVGVNTARTNTLVKEAIETGKVAEFQNIDAIKSEVKISDKSRLDLQLLQGEKSTYIEVKNCSLAVENCAMFPDAVTARGTKHLRELISLCANGSQACIFFLVQRMDADRFEPAAQIDHKYTTTLNEAKAAGVMVLAYQAEVSPEGIEVVRALPCKLN